MIPGWVLLTAAAVLLVGYLGGESRLDRRGDRWPVPRTTSAVGSALALTAAGLWPLRSSVDDVVVHLLVTMAAPLLLAVSAPVTLALRTLPRPLRKLLVRVLHSRWSRAVTWLPTATSLEAGGLWLYYLSPLPQVLPWTHGLLMAHMVVAGWLFSTVLVGPDPLPRRPGVVARSFALVSVSTVHDLVAKLLYARGGDEAAVVLYQGGDVIEVAAAAVLFGQWYARHGRATTKAGHHACRWSAPTRSGRRTPGRRNAEAPGCGGSVQPGN